jgi:hypothetical protein
LIVPKYEVTATVRLVLAVRFEVEAANAEEATTLGVPRATTDLLSRRIEVMMPDGYVGEVFAESIEAPFDAEEIPGGDWQAHRRTRGREDLTLTGLALKKAFGDSEAGRGEKP